MISLAPSPAPSHATSVENLSPYYSTTCYVSISPWQGDYWWPHQLCKQPNHRLPFWRSVFRNKSLFYLLGSQQQTDCTLKRNIREFSGGLFKRVWAKLCKANKKWQSTWLVRMLFPPVGLKVPGRSCLLKFRESWRWRESHPAGAVALGIGFQPLQSSCDRKGARELSDLAFLSHLPSADLFHWTGPVRSQRKRGSTNW